MDQELKDILAFNPYMVTRAEHLGVNLEQIWKELYSHNDVNNHQRFIAEVWEEIDRLK